MISIIKKLFITLFLMLLAQNSFASIEFDAAASGENSTDILSATASHTIGSGSNRLVVAFSCTEDGTSTDLNTTSITYDGNNLTESAGVTIGSSIFNRIEMWFILEADLPSTGTYTVQSNFAGFTFGAVLTVMSFTGVKQQAPEVTGTTTASSTDTINLSVTTVTDNAMVMDGVCDGNNRTFVTTESGQIERADQDSSSGGGSNTGASSNKPTTTAGSETMGWTSSSSTNRLSLVVGAWEEEAVAVAAVESIRWYGGPHKLIGDMKFIN